MRVFAVIYADLEAYPPSLNAVLCMAERCERVMVFQRTIGRSCWEFPHNVSIRTLVDHSGRMALAGLGRFWDFLRFVGCIAVALRRECPDLMVAYDPIPLLACRIASRVSGWHGFLWYHNHDTEKAIRSRRWSVGWWACMFEKRSLGDVDLLSLPAREREAYFPLQTLASKPAFLPNYPSTRHYGSWNPAVNGNEVRLVYQGSLGRNHGFEDLIGWLDRLIDGRRWSLTLLGKIDPGYKRDLLQRAAACGVEDRFRILEFVPLTDLPRKLAEYTIGLALHLPVGVTYSTGATASNKIYEYAASGLPVLLYDTPHYRTHLGSRYWVDFCILDWLGFSGAISRLLAKGPRAALAARTDFERELNYEFVFPSVWEMVLEGLSEKRSKQGPCSSG